MSVTMPRRKELTIQQRSEILGMVKAGMTMSAVARTIKRPLSTVANILKKNKTTGSVANKKSGRPHKATQRDLRHLQKIVREDRRVSCKVISQNWSQASRKTFSQRTTPRRLKDLGFRGRAARKKPFVSEINKRRSTMCP